MSFTTVTIFLEIEDCWGGHRTHSKNRCFKALFPALLSAKNWQKSVGPETTPLSGKVWPRSGLHRSTVVK